MALQYRTQTGDMVDYIAWKHYGTTDRGVVEKLLEANKGLSDYGPLLPAGVLVNLPEINTTQAVRGVKLWG